jgi:hypothetical protein
MSYRNALLVVILSLLTPRFLAAAESTPLADAMAVWQLGDASGRGGRLSVEGNVELGVAVPDAERDASRARGGDGLAAAFHGGHLIIPAEPTASLPAGKAMTLCVRVRLADGAVAGNLLGWKGQGGRPAFRLFVGEFASKPSLIVELATDARDRSLRLSAPLAVLGAAEWHDVVVRYLAYRLELFVDGVLVDEEWPSGSLLAADGPLLVGAAVGGEAPQEKFSGVIDHVALWNRVSNRDARSSVFAGQAAIGWTNASTPRSTMPKDWTARSIWRSS